MAWAPVPLIGQSSMTWPALRSLASAAVLSSSVKVEASTMTRRGTLALTMVSTVAASAFGLGRLVMMVFALRATSPASLAISTPARAMARRRAGAMS